MEKPHVRTPHNGYSGTVQLHLRTGLCSALPGSSAWLRFGLRRPWRWWRTADGSEPIQTWSAFAAAAAAAHLDVVARAAAAAAAAETGLKLSMQLSPQLLLPEACPCHDYVACATATWRDWLHCQDLEECQLHLEIDIRNITSPLLMKILQSKWEVISKKDKVYFIQYVLKSSFLQIPSQIYSQK